MEWEFLLLPHLTPPPKKPHKARILKMSRKQIWLNVDSIYNQEEELGTGEHFELLDEFEMTNENRNCSYILKTYN